MMSLLPDPNGILGVFGNGDAKILKVIRTYIPQRMP